MEGIIEQVSGFAPGVATVVVVLLAVLIFTKPIRVIFKLLLNTALGFVALILINRFGADLGIVLGVNWVNAAVVGILGLPGLALLLVLRWMMLI